MLPEEKRIKTREDLNRYLKIERGKYWKSFCKGIFHITENDLLVSYSRLLRKTEFHKNVGHKLRYIYFKLRLCNIQNRTGIYIRENCCEEGLKIMHVGSIRMNPNCIVGKNCSIHVGTGIVPNGLSSASPTLGDGVVVGIGAKIVGGIKIADNVAIGANAVVTKDITEPNVTVAGIPAKIISNHGRLDWCKSTSN